MVGIDVPLSSTVITVLSQVSIVADVSVEQILAAGAGFDRALEACQPYQLRHETAVAIHHVSRRL